MNCPKCSVSIPNDSVFCPTCGCNIEETEKQIKIEQALEVIQSPEVNSNATTVEVKKSKSTKVLAFLLVLSIICCCVLGYFTYSFYNQSLDYNKQISDNIAQIKNLEGRNKALQSSYDKTAVARNAVAKLQTFETWGYATENFHASTGVICLNSYGNTKSIEVVMNYSNSTCYVESSDTSVVDFYWSDKTWYYGDTTNLYLEPLAKGISVLTFTNSAYDSTFSILVIVED